jgi:tRNA modification GTPase
LIDTAGLDACASGVSASAQRMTARQLDEADLTLACADATMPPASAAIASVAGRDSLLVLTKVDLLPAVPPTAPDAIATSSKTGAGLDELRAAIRRRIEAATRDGAVAPTAVRCRDSLRLAAESLQRAGAAASAGLGEELVAAEVRIALDALGRVVGAVYTDDILDRVFSRFCIGK